MTSSSATPIPMPPLTGAVTVYAEAYAVSDSEAGASLAEFELDGALLSRLRKLHALCNDNDLSEARMRMGPTWGPYGIEDELRLVNNELVVVPDGSFWFVADVKHGDYHVETRSIDIESLAKRLDDVLLNNGDVIYEFEGSNLKHFLREVAEHQDAKAERAPSP